MDLQITHSIAEIGPETWNSLSGGRPFSSFRWYSFGEAVLADCQPTYMILREGERPIARAAFWLKHREWLPITSKLFRKGMERVLDRRPLFVCETPLACLPGMILPESSDRAAALKKISQTARGLAKDSHALCTLFSYINLAEARQTEWPENFAPLSYSDPETIMPIAWIDYESYIEHLGSATRRNIRRNGQAARELGITIKVQDTVEAVDEIVKLIQNVEASHKVGYRPWARAMLENAHRVDFRCITAWQAERLLGCVSLFGDGTAQSATLLGLDYGFEPWLQVYNQVIYALIRHAIESGCKELYGGGGAYEFKRRLGFQKLPDDTMVLAPAGWFASILWNGSVRLMKRFPKKDHQTGLEECLNTGDVG